MAIPLPPSIFAARWGVVHRGLPMEITIGKAQRGLSDPLPTQAYVGRPTALGNPFAIGRDGSRAEVIQLYRA